MNFPGRHIVVFSVLVTGTIAGFAAPASALSQLSSETITATFTATFQPTSNDFNQFATPKTIADRSVAEMRLITPGKRVGLISFDMTYRNLVNAFGAKRLTNSVTYGPEGMGQWPATIVNLGKGYKVKVTWSNDSKTKMTRMTIGKGGENWRTAEGIGIGTTFSTLKTQMGRFNIPGFGWDYGNRVLSKNPKFKGMSIQIVPSESAMRRHGKTYQSVAGDQMLKSTDQRLTRLGLKVSRIDLYAPAPSRQAKVHETFLIQPGKQVGPIQFNSTYTTLVKQFGHQNLKSAVTYGPEGMGQWPATIVNVGPGQRVKVTWKDARKNHISYMTIDQTGSAWKTADGLGIGSNHQKLQKELGQFRISGFGWDYGNRVISNSRKVKNLSLEITPSQTAIQRNPKTYQSVLGDQTIQSNDQRLQTLGLYVSRIYVWNR